MALLNAIEAKVKAATAVSFVASLAVALLNAIVGDSSLLGPLPAWLQGLVLAVIPTVLTFLGGYAAPHTARTLPAPGPVAAVPPVV